MTPTQAQIEAADKLAVQIVTLVTDKLYNGKLYAYDGIEAAREIKKRILDLTAAAQVGFVESILDADKAPPEGAISKIEELTLDSYTIERCAQVVDDKADEWGVGLGADIARELAAAIRALKDK